MTHDLYLGRFPSLMIDHVHNENATLDINSNMNSATNNKINMMTK